MMINTEKIKKDFPIFKFNSDLVYLDNAATTQMPQTVIDAVNKYYTEYKSNIHRGAYKLSELATKKYEESRGVVADFINAETNEIIFTSGTTHSLNALAYSLCKNLKPGDNVVLTKMEHHANLVPWQEMSKQYGFELKFIDLKDEILDLESNIIDQNTKIVSFVHVSNSLGTITPVKEIVELAKEVGAVSIVDAAQSAPHMKIDVRDLDCDYLVFSGHKLGGPTGIGVMYGKSEKLENLDPFLFGGGMIGEVTLENTTWADVPHKFEAGTPNIAGAIGMAEAIKYLNNIGMENIEKHGQELSNYALEQLKKIEHLNIFGKTSDSTSIISFTIDGVHPHDAATILDRNGVAVRAGHHCTMPLMAYLQISGTIRASFWIYNDKNDVDKLIKGIREVIKIFKN